MIDVVAAKQTCLAFCHICSLDKKECSVIANKTAINWRPEDNDVCNYRIPYGLQQVAKLILYSNYKN